MIDAKMTDNTDHFRREALPQIQNKMFKKWLPARNRLRWLHNSASVSKSGAVAMTLTGVVGSFLPLLRSCNRLQAAHLLYTDLSRF
jgi:hypothetical protein